MFGGRSFACPANKAGAAACARNPRRVVRMAVEDIGIADPRGLQLCLQGWQTFERLGSPEGELAIAQGVVYLACAAKSNAVYSAYKAAMQDAREAAVERGWIYPQIIVSCTEEHRAVAFGVQSAVTNIMQ